LQVIAQELAASGVHRFDAEWRREDIAHGPVMLIEGHSLQFAFVTLSSNYGTS
jgi:hypothetical protein